MKRISKFSILLIAVALVSPTFAHSADSIPEQWTSLTTPGAGYIGYENGEANTATTVINEKNGWFKLGAYGFTFSSPTVRVKLTQDAEATAPMPTPSPTASASAAPVAAKKTSITCVKGKTSKKVTAVNPACPKGYKKK